MNEIDLRILLGVLRRESLKEMAAAVGLAISVVHGRLVALRDGGYIKPWERQKARLRDLTPMGKLAVQQAYGQRVLHE